MSGGRPTKYNKEIQAKADDYVENFSDHNKVPSIVGLALYLKLNPDTMYDWRDKHKAFSETLATCKQTQEVVLLDKGLTNEFNATIVKLMLHNHGYSDKVEQDLKSSDGTMKPTIIEIVAYGEDKVEEAKDSD